MKIEVKDLYVWKNLIVINLKFYIVYVYVFDDILDINIFIKMYRYMKWYYIFYIL